MINVSVDVSPLGRILFQMDPSSAIQVVDQIVARCTGSGFRPAMNEGARIVRRSFAEDFSQGGRPPWAPLKQSTVGAKTRAGLPALNPSGRVPWRLKQNNEFGPHSILIASGALRDSYVRKGAKGHVERVDLSGKTLEIGSAARTRSGAPYAVFHQYGASRPGTPWLLPARPVEIQDEDVAAMAAATRDHILGNLQNVGEGI